MSRRQQQDWKEDRLQQEKAANPGKKPRGRGRGGRGRGRGKRDSKQKAARGGGRGGGRGGRAATQSMKRPAASTRKAPSSKQLSPKKSASNAAKPKKRTPSKAVRDQKNNKTPTSKASKQDQAAEQALKEDEDPSDNEAQEKVEPKAKRARKQAAKQESSAQNEQQAKNDNKTTFARRYCPKSGPNFYKWHGLRDVYENHVAAQLSRPSMHEETESVLFFVATETLSLEPQWIASPLQASLRMLSGSSSPSAIRGRPTTAPPTTRTGPCQSSLISSRNALTKLMPSS